MASDLVPCRMSHHVAFFPFMLTRARIRVKERKPVMIRHASCLVEGGRYV